MKAHRRVRPATAITLPRKRTSNASTVKAISSALSFGSSGRIARQSQTASRGKKHLEALNVKPQEEQLAIANRADVPTAVNSTKAHAKNPERSSKTGRVGHAEARI